MSAAVPSEARPGEASGTGVLPSDVLRAVAAHYGLTVEDLRCHRRMSPKVGEARKVACYLAVRETRATMTRIGYVFNRDHSTVMQHHAMVRDLVARRSPLGTLVGRITRRLHGEDAP